MRHGLALQICTLAALATLPAMTAEADSWCIRDSAGLSPGICVFSSLQDCMRTALINPAVGSCAREEYKPPAAAPAEKRPAKRRDARVRRSDGR